MHASYRQDTLTQPAEAVGVCVCVHIYIYVYIYIHTCIYICMYTRKVLVNRGGGHTIVTPPTSQNNIGFSYNC